MKYICILAFFLTIIGLESCKIDQDKFHSTTSSCSPGFLILDSISIDSKESLNYLDFDKANGKLLFIELFSNKLIETDLTGEILTTLSPWGESGESIGTKAATIGYAQDGVMIIGTERGIFYVHEDLRVEPIIKGRNTFLVEAWKNVVSFGKNKILVVDELFFDPREGIPNNQSIEYFEDFRLFSLIDLKNRVKEGLVIGCHEESVFRNTPDGEIYFPDMWAYYTQFNDGVAVLIAPDHRISVYSENDIDNPLQLTFTLDHWQRMSNSELKNISIENLWVLNSSFVSLSSDEEKLVVCYRSGNPAFTDNLNNMDGFIDDTQKYCFFLYPKNSDHSIGVKSSEFEIPNRLNTFLVSLEKDIFLVDTNPTVVEHKEKSVFYIVKTECLE